MSGRPVVSPHAVVLDEVKHREYILTIALHEHIKDKNGNEVLVRLHSQEKQYLTPMLATQALNLAMGGINKC